MSNSKKWSSFDEVHSSLYDQGYFESSGSDNINELNSIVKELENAESSKIFFDATCKISVIFEKLSKEETRRLYHATNIYVRCLNACLYNIFFINTIVNLSLTKKNIEDLKNESKYFENLTYINTVLTTAFFPLSIGYSLVPKESVQFLRDNITSLVKNITKQNNEIDFFNTCFFLEKVIWDKRLNFTENKKSPFPVKLDDNYLFSNLKISRSIGGICFLSLVIRQIFEKDFKKQISYISKEDFSVTKALDVFNQTANRFHFSFEHYYRNAPVDLIIFFNIFIKKNEKNLVFYFKEFCKDYHFQKDKKIYEVIQDKIDSAELVKNKIEQYSLINLSAFNKSIQDEDVEWTNKIFLTSIKTLSVLESLKKASDKKWAFSVALRELQEWITNIHGILNKFYIEDDWEEIKEYCKFENSEVEWKSTFFTPTQQETFTLEMSNSTFGIIIKTILAMINTNGGNLIVGLVEFPEKIINDQVKNNLIYKNGVCFYNVSSELKNLNKTLDQVRIQILDRLKTITNVSVDQFNNLIEFIPINLKNEESVVSILRIKILPTKKLFFHFREENSTKWISLVRRADGQTVYVDPREHI